MIRVASYPHAEDLQPQATAGISAVVNHYFEYLPKYDIELVAKGADADLAAIHAGSIDMLPNLPIVSHCHGLYFTADSKMDSWTHEVNQTVIDVLRHATVVTVPSNWVAEVFRRDMHIDPAVIPHGVEWGRWQKGIEDLGYVLWNKNRSSDACDPTPVNELAVRAPKLRFLSTYAAPNPSPNIRVTGTVAHKQMRDMILKCSVYLATTKETFGIGTLEAMSAGKPVLGFDWGGTADLVQHGFSGYLARPGDYADLAQGLNYCLSHAMALGNNARAVAMNYTWDNTAKLVAEQYARTVELSKDSYDVAVIIPMYNKAATIARAIRSAINQMHKPHAIIVVNNNSTDDFSKEIDGVREEALSAYIRLEVVNCEAQGVAHARNYGIRLSEQSLICCLDADDEILPDFLMRCREALVADRSLGIAYTAMEVVDQAGSSGVSQWPGEYNFDAVPKGRNQVPTCCLFRREAWERAGGYRQRYAPNGAGSEDADLWLRIGLLGYNGKRVTPQALFRYYLGGLVSGNPQYQEKDWRGDKGWLALKEMPFAAPTTPANGMAHPVRQYDEPEVSVIIPVGPGHVWMLWDALDSVEGQTFRQWEVKVIKDDQDAVAAREDQEWRRLKKAFPFARFHMTSDGPRGAGYARNVGAELAKAPLLLFLDADDWLTPTALADLIAVHNDHPNDIIYSDYYGHAYIQEGATLQRLRKADRLVEYKPETLEAKVLYHAFNFDCEKAQRQPEPGKDPYIWNIISSLVPKEYHKEIGGFDEKMESWEDWDYWVRMAKAGHCFYRLEKPLLEYRFYTGKRRSLANPSESGDGGRQLSAHLLEYMQDKYGRIENMPGCSGCGGRRSSPPPAPSMSMRTLNEGIANMSSDDMVMVELTDGNIGDHLVAFAGTSYGYRVHGDHFQMKRSHAELDRRVRIIDVKVKVAAKVTPTPTPPPPPGPLVFATTPSGATALVDKDDDDEGDVDDDANGEVHNAKVAGTSFVPPAPNAESANIANPGPPAYDFTQLWGVNEDRAALLTARAVRTLDGLIMLGREKISELFKVPDATARRIIAEAERTQSAERKTPSGKKTK